MWRSRCRCQASRCRLPHHRGECLCSAYLRQEANANVPQTSPERKLKFDLLTHDYWRELTLRQPKAKTNQALAYTSVHHMCTLCMWVLCVLCCVCCVWLC
ncbi:hypothetical protein K431DRAFT_17705 [Polychaeton citri CBS 116435]|uniref:Uncharacterized protein n=1 Tax=Polychaeton citri CBS 116435 TaxID=1314669 RepID=A0A9P4QDM5_9PEZI|nr:hypothetical protein K431DRAFT_17705 [Polychaeton citri CBS 116435]